MPVLFHRFPVILDSFTGWGRGQGVDPWGDTDQTHRAGKFTWGVGPVHRIGALYGRGDRRGQGGAGDLRQTSGSCHGGADPKFSYELTIGVCKNKKNPLN